MKKCNILNLLIVVVVSILLFLIYMVRSAAAEELIPDWTGVEHAPFNLIAPSGITNPVLTANDVTDVSAGFVADPFLFYENRPMAHVL